MDSSQINFCPYVILSRLPQPAAASSLLPGQPHPHWKKPQNCWGLEIYHSLGPLVFTSFSWGSSDWGTLLFLPLCLAFPPPECLVLKDINPLARLWIPLAVVEVETNLFRVGALLYFSNTEQKAVWLIQCILPALAGWWEGEGAVKSTKRTITTEDWQPVGTLRAGTSSLWENQTVPWFNLTEKNMPQQFQF